MAKSIIKTLESQFFGNSFYIKFINSQIYICNYKDLLENDLLYKSGNLE